MFVLASNKELLKLTYYFLSLFCADEGMMHLMDHEKVNNYLLKLMETEGLAAQLSYDGLRVPVVL